MRHRWASRLALCVALSLGLACAGSSSDVTAPPTGNNPPPEQPNPPEPPTPPPPAPPPPEHPPPGPPVANPAPLGSGARVLFVGNSLTEVNNVPALVQNMASAEQLGWVIESELIGGTSLEDHWNRGAIQDRIVNGNWDVVVLQQGPSSLPESRANLRQWTREFDTLIKEHGGLSALYEVWPESNRFEFFDRVRDSYALAARDVTGFFLPAGESWRAAWRVTPSLALYGGDGFHPTLAGSYAAALTIFSGLSGHSTVGLPAPAGVDQQTAERLQQAALEALERYGDYNPANAP